MSASLRCFRYGHLKSCISRPFTRKAAVMSIENSLAEGQPRGEKTVASAERLLDKSPECAKNAAAQCPVEAITVVEN